MEKRVPTTVDAASWGNKPVPPGFVSGPEIFNIGEVLLTIGIITAPPRASGFSLSEFWAWVRYVSAISAEYDLALVQEYFDLDAHQKTILSDDFGMGFSVYWLWKRMNFSFICDGRYFVDKFLRRHYRGAPPARIPGKRGPTKCPDFVCWSPAGRFHVVECKGTQSGPYARAKQVAAAKVQKTTIDFPTNRQGEQLACAMQIGYEGGRQRSGLLVADPERKPVLVVSDNDVSFAEDTMYRGLASRILASSGLSATALALAEPDIGEQAASRSTESRISKEYLMKKDKLRRDRASEELGLNKGKALFFESGTSYVGREVTFDLPLPVDTGGAVARRATVRQGVNQELLESFNPERFAEPLGNDTAPLLFDAKPDFRPESVGAHSVVRLGNLFQAEIEFLP